MCLVWTWLRRLFKRKSKETPPETPPRWAIELGEQLSGDDPPPWAVELGEQIGNGTPPTWGSELTELVQRAARAQGKSALRLEELERKLEGGFADLRHLTQAAARPAEHLRWDDVLDAMDLLEEASAALQATHPSVAQGLGGVQLRLVRHLSAAGLVRLTPLHAPPDGTQVRIVGTEEQPDLPEGVVTRVVRAAVKRGDQLVREGEVLTNRRLS